MRTDTLTLAKALEQIAQDMDCEDGIATAAMQEAAERLREYAADDWQPIDTAPKDGSEIILYLDPRVAYECAWARPYLGACRLGARKTWCILECGTWDKIEGKPKAWKPSAKTPQ